MAEEPKAFDAELVDMNHPYMTEHDEREFVWGFDSEKALEWTGAVVGSIIDHADHGGPQHAIDQMAIQSGILVSDALIGTQFPVLMMHHESEDGSSGYTPVAIMLVSGDKQLDIAHTLGSLVDEDGVHPALPSRMADDFYEPPAIEQEPTPPTTVFDLLRKQREDDA
jgi:hypothetical protein